MSTGADIRAGGQSWSHVQLTAMALSSFAACSVVYWIHAARWRFAQAMGDAWDAPATISRSIAPPEIGGPFSVWVTVAGLCLIVSVGVLCWHYWSMAQMAARPSRAVRLLATFGVPLVFVLQVASGWGMHTLSVNSLNTDRDMHMMGSYVFFVSQALVILIYAVQCRVLVRDAATLAELETAGLISAPWVRRRSLAAFATFGLALSYGGLFVLKDVFPYDETPIIHVTYVTTEWVVITAYLVVVVLAHVDKLRVPLRLCIRPR